VRSDKGCKNASLLSQQPTSQQFSNTPGEGCSLVKNMICCKQISVSPRFRNTRWKAMTATSFFSQRVCAGSRTYFFDAKSTEDGTKYLVISESRHNGRAYEHHRVMIFEEHLRAFAEGFQQALRFFQTMPAEPARKRMSSADDGVSSVSRVRQRYSQAYKSWSLDEDERLRKSYEQGSSIAELASQHQRTPGAIRARLAKLGLR
jgi:hypothetical protein